jgi:hypothetical protein
MKTVLKLLQLRKHLLNDKWHTLMVNSTRAGIQRHCAQTYQLHSGSAQTPAITSRITKGTATLNLVGPTYPLTGHAAREWTRRLWALVRIKRQVRGQSTKQLPRTARLDRFILSAE